MLIFAGATEGLLRALSWLYLVLGLLSLGLIFIGTSGLFAMQPIPQAHRFASWLALPWSYTDFYGTRGASGSLAPIIVGMIVNFTLLRWLATRLSR
jgi:hypothetical protein